MRTLALFAAICTLACSGPVTSDPDAGIADAGDAAVTPDAALPSPRPVAPLVEPTPLTPRWITGWAGGTSDPLIDVIEAGELTVPTREGLAYGLEWLFYDPGETHQFEDFRSGYYWAAATLEVPDGHGVIFRADRALSIHLGTQRQPGDIYGSGAIRVPLARGRGDDALAIRMLTGRGAPVIQLWSTPDELWMNTSDLIVPDIVVGETDEQWIGVPILNLTDHAALDATARVVGDDRWQETTIEHPALPGGAVTQVAFRLAPTAAFDAPEEGVSVRVRIESDSMRWSYEREVRVNVVARGEPYRRTFRSDVDGSAQYYGVRPPPDAVRGEGDAMVLALHGASVQAIGHAQAYSSRDWAWIVAPTNRRPFGFDWEVWGRLDALEVLADATRTFGTDPTRVYVTGHSMGGHGTWQLSTLFPGRFAVSAPSAGWSSFYSYVGAARPSGAFARSMASSDTSRYASNLARRRVYVLHGDADDNVPVREARDMVALLEPLMLAPGMIEYHEEPGAGHWWDGEAAPGADCVDWLPIFEAMQATRLDPFELEFDFVSPSPWVSPTHSYVTIRAALDPMEDVRVVSGPGAGADELVLTSTNVRGMTLDGDALGERGVARVIVDGTSVDVAAGTITVGLQDGKHSEVHGPFDQALMRPFCLVYPDDGPAILRDYAAYLASWWQVQGNGSACALPESEVDDALYASRNIVWIGRIGASARWAGEAPIGQDGGSVRVGTASFDSAVLAFAYPQADGSRLGGGIVVTPGDENLLFRLQPYSSQFVPPDYLVFGDGGVETAGFFAADWSLP